MDIKESVQQFVKHSDEVTKRFYSLFFEHVPEARPLFQSVNMGEQFMNLTTALLVVERYYTSSSGAARSYLNYLGTKHKDRGVLPDHYPKFQEALLRTLREFHGPDWGPELETQWRGAFEGACEAMFKGYRERFHV
jgi:hemoglobin-like flavoprotein